MIKWEKEFDNQWANHFLDEKYMDKLNLGDRVKTFIENVLKESLEEYKEEHECCVSEAYINGIINTEKQLKLDEKELDKILKNFYEHMCGVDDYGCELCLKYKQQILDLQGEK